MDIHPTWETHHLICRSTGYGYWKTQTRTHGQERSFLLLKTHRTTTTNLFSISTSRLSPLWETHDGDNDGVLLVQHLVCHSFGKLVMGTLSSLTMTLMTMVVFTTTTTTVINVNPVINTSPQQLVVPPPNDPAPTV